MNVGRKIPHYFENPIDNVIIDICEQINPILFYLNITPNIITSCSLIIGIISGLLVYKGCFIIGGLTYFIAYILDCMDGNFARTYNMVTIFGDWYDHVSDVMKIIIIILAITTNSLISFNNKLIFMFGFTILQITSAIHMGCQEKIYNNPSQTLRFTQYLCAKPSYIRYSRYVGVGTMISFVTLFIILQSYI